MIQLFVFNNINYLVQSQLMIIHDWQSIDYIEASYSVVKYE